MDTSDALDRLDAAVGTYDHLAPRILRIALGGIILLAGAHKLVAPAVWHAYLAPPLLTLWPTAVVPLDPAFVAFGVSEVVFGLLILADWHTPTVAFVTALSLLGVVANLALGAAVGEPVVDVLIRDLGLTVFAFGTALTAGGRPSAGGDT